MAAIAMTPSPASPRPQAAARRRRAVTAAPQPPRAGAHPDHGPLGPARLGAARHAAPDPRGHRRVRARRRRSSGSTTAPSSDAPRLLPRLQGRPGREGPGARRPARPRRRPARRARPGHPHSPGPRGRRRQRVRRDLGAPQRLELRHHHLRPRRLRPHQRPHPGAAADRRRHQRLAAAQPRTPARDVRRRRRALPGVRRAARRRERQPARRLGHRREDRRHPARAGRLDARRSGPTSTTTTAGPGRGPGLRGPRRPARAGSARPSYAGSPHPAPASATTSTCE